MNQVRSISLLTLFCLAATGCSCFPPLKTDSTICMTIAKPVVARVDANMHSLTDPGPLVEVVVACQGTHPCGPKVALIEVDGLLLNVDTAGAYSMGENPVAAFQEKLTAAAGDPAVKAVVLRINSPGGGVGASELMGHSLADFRKQTGKPVVACFLDQGAGGAYYLACGCDQIVAMPATVIGGVGVILNLYWLQQTMEKQNVFAYPIKSGERIDMGTPIREITDQEKKLLTDMAKEYHDNFAQVVRHGRPRLKANSGIFDGRVMASSKAMEEGLIDAIGFLPDAIDMARQLAKDDAVNVVMYCRHDNPTRSMYDTTPNKTTPAQTIDLFHIPGLDRSKLPLFLYLWQIEPTLVHVGGQ
jgi:protease IV